LLQSDFKVLSNHNNEKHQDSFDGFIQVLCVSDLSLLLLWPDVCELRNILKLMISLLLFWPDVCKLRNILSC